MSNLEQFTTPSASYSLQRIPEIPNDTLRAWDAADELIMNTVFSDYADSLDKPASQAILIANDTFGALSVAFNEYAIDSWSDSYVSHLATEENLKLNNIDKADTLRFIPSSEAPQSSSSPYKLVIIKIPKTLSLLEDQLLKLKPYINKETKIIASAMTKNIHNSTLALFEKYIGTTTTSKATKKARLIFSENDLVNDASSDNSDSSENSPYPNIIKDEKIQITLFNHANVFAKDKLDVGTRFLIQNMDQCPKADHVIDIGCGNGALGIMLKRYQPNAKISFVDESYNALASAKESYNFAYPESAQDASFHLSNSLEQFQSADPENKAQLVLCNPPFHQVHSIGDHIAWEMFRQSRDALATDGEMWIVGNRHLGYHIKLKKVFGNCRTIATNPKFVILAATKLDKLNRVRK